MPTPNSHALLLLGFPWLMGITAMLVDKSGPSSRFMIRLAAGLFGMAVGLHAVRADLPLPASLRFVAMASLATLAFHRAWLWIGDTLA